MPRPTAAARRAISPSAWVSLVSAAARLTLSPSASPAQPSRSASAIRAAGLSRMRTSRSRWSGSIRRSGHLTQHSSDEGSYPGAATGPPERPARPHSHTAAATRALSAAPSQTAARPPSPARPVRDLQHSPIPLLHDTQPPPAHPAPSLRPLGDRRQANRMPKAGNQHGVSPTNRNYCRPATGTKVSSIYRTRTAAWYRALR
jgi:hypothetical protein